MPAPITLNEEVVAVTTRDDFDFVFTTDTPPYAEDNGDGHIFKLQA